MFLGVIVGVQQWKGSIQAGITVSKEINARGFFFVIYENLRVGNCAIGFVGYSNDAVTIVSDPSGILRSGNYLHISKNGATVSFTNEKTMSTSFIMTIVG